MGVGVTLTVNGVETGQKLITTAGVDTAIQPGAYRGNVVLTVAQATSVEWFGTIFPIRQALYTDDGGVDESKSVSAAVQGGKVTDTQAKNVRIVSRDEGFNGVWTAGGEYALQSPKISLSGNGRYDFVGAGAAIVTAGAGTRLVVDDADINNTGVVRTGIVASDGSNLIVKNSDIDTHEGQLPADYTPTLLPGQMRSAPWMLGIVGNVRATNLVGTNTKATYINSDVFSTGWGVLSTDSTTNGQLTAINTKITTGQEGYGAYADGQTVTDRFLGSTFDVDDYAAISTGGDLTFDDSDPSVVDQLNQSLDLRLTTQELKKIKDQRTTIKSNRFGVMWHGGGQTGIDGGTVNIGGRTVVNTAKTMFVDKGLQVQINVDGAEGAQLRAGNGVIWQMMDSDDPGPVFVDGRLVNQGVYHEPTGTPEKVADFDVTAAHADDAVANLSSVKVRGDFYNGLRTTKNMVLNLSGSTVTGLVSSSTTRHAIDTITAADYRQISEVTNSVGPAVNNGVLLTLKDKSIWQVTGTSYLTRLELSADSKIVGADGRTVSVTVNGVPTTLSPGGTYSGAIVVKAA